MSRHNRISAVHCPASEKEYKDYERVSKLSAILDELVVHVEAVHLQDSLQTLAKMPESERLAVIDKIIEQVKKEEGGSQGPGRERSLSGGTGGKRDWYRPSRNRDWRHHITDDIRRFRFLFL